MSPRKVLKSSENIGQNTSLEVGTKEDHVESQQQAEGPPKPCRTAFICFSDAKREEIAQNLGLDDVKIQDFSAAWKALSKEERAHWDEVARQDKVRYVKEKSEYKGPWDLPKRRAKKHPLAPKRPMSAFLKFSKKRRTMIKEENPDLGNTDVSRLLGELWRNAPPEEKRHYQETELVERAQYKVAIAKFKADMARQDAAHRINHDSIQSRPLHTAKPPAPARPHTMNRRALPLNRDHSVFKNEPPPPPPVAPHDMVHHGYYSNHDYAYSSFGPSYSFSDDKGRPVFLNDDLGPGVRTFSDSFDSTEPVPPLNIFANADEQQAHTHVQQAPRQYCDENNHREKGNRHTDSFGFHGRY